MKLSIFVIGVALCACLIAGSHAHDHDHSDDDHEHHCRPDHHHHHHHHPHHHRQSTHASRIRIKSFHGKHYPPSPRETETRDEEDQARPIPVGKPRGPISPSSPAVDLTMLQLDNDNTNHRRLLQATPGSANVECGGTGVNFNRSSILGSGGFPTEPSGAKAGNVIFATGNWFASVSIDDGITFHHLEPTVYSGPADPATTGPFCCDQVVHYIPQIDRFVWLMLFSANNNNTNKMRIISFHPRDVDTAGINAWIYLDLFSTQFNLPGSLDYGDLAVGDNFLYVSANGGAPELFVIRVPIPGLNVVGSLTLWYTDPARGNTASFSHLSQNPGDTVFWAGHQELGTTMRIFKWPESGTTYYWSDIRINDWPSNNANFIAPCPGSTNTSWIIDAQFHDIIGVTRRSVNEVWFSWPAPSGGGFPNVHVQVVQIDPSRWPTLRLVKQWQIWNPDFAFAYPALYTNECGDVGIAVGFGGGSFSPSSAVGIADSSGILGGTVFYPELSDVCENRWGDYLTVRQGDGNDYAAFVYAQSTTASGIVRNARYLQFGKV